MISGYPIVGKSYVAGRFMCWVVRFMRWVIRLLGMPSIAVRPSLVTPSNDAGVETAVTLSYVPACPYAGPLFD
jgi:hypothetical protein